MGLQADSRASAAAKSQGEVPVMTQSAIAHTSVADSREAGTVVGSQVLKEFQGNPPHALILFISSRYDYEAVLKAVDASCRPAVMVGCSSAGEFTKRTQEEGSICAVALRSTDMQFVASLGRGLQKDSAAAARSLVSGFRGLSNQDFLYRSALVLTDALAGHADNFLDQLTLLTSGTYQFFGGGAGDDARFQRTHVFFGTESFSDAGVALEILSKKPLGIGVRHGWKPAGPPLRVTAAEGMRLISLNAAPAVEALQEHAKATGQRFDPADPMSFFLHNIFGIAVGQDHRLRVPLAVHEDGSVACAADIPVGSTVHIMRTSAASASEAAVTAAEAALRQLKGHRPKVTLFFDCVATRLRMGREFGFELDAVRNAVGVADLAGCNTYGQIARSEGQFDGFHNCTAVVCAIPE
jgi:hypothetical protein